jgi:hypothetical protein
MDRDEQRRSLFWRKGCPRWYQNNAIQTVTSRISRCRSTNPSTATPRLREPACPNQRRCAIWFPNRRVRYTAEHRCIDRRPYRAARRREAWWSGQRNFEFARRGINDLIQNGGTQKTRHLVQLVIRSGMKDRPAEHRTGVAHAGM